MSVFDNVPFIPYVFPFVFLYVFPYVVHVLSVACVPVLNIPVILKFYLVITNFL